MTTKLLQTESREILRKAINMTDERMRVKIAEFMHEGSQGYKNGCRCPDCCASMPNYPEDLNACHEMWQCLGWEEKNECIDHLREIVKDADCEVYFATARQRCEAFLRTIGQYEEDK